MIGLYEKDVNGLFKDFVNLGECKKGDTVSIGVFLKYNGNGFARNIMITSLSPDLKIEGEIPTELQSGQVVPLNVLWSPTESKPAGGLVLRAEEVIQKDYV